MCLHRGTHEQHMQSCWRCAQEAPCVCTTESYAPPWCALQVWVFHRHYLDTLKSYGFGSSRQPTSQISVSCNTVWCVVCTKTLAVCQAHTERAYSPPAICHWRASTTPALGSLPQVTFHKVTARTNKHILTCHMSFDCQYNTIMLVRYVYLYHIHVRLCSNVMVKCHELPVQHLGDRTICVNIM